MPGNDKVDVKITHPNGVNMRYSESISAFLMARADKSSQFYLGHWLSSLDSEQLAQLSYLSHQYLDGVEERYLDDIVMVVITAISAETRNPSVELSPEFLHESIGALHIATCVESLSRSGRLELHDTLSIDPHKEVQARITDLGMRDGKTLQSMFH